MHGPHKCPCGADLPTLRGLRSHQTQSRECKAWAARAKAAISSPTSSSDSEDELEGLEGSEPATTPPADDDLDSDNIDIGSPLPPDPPVIEDSDEKSMMTQSSSRKRHYVHEEDVDSEEDESLEADSVYIQEFPAQFRAGWKKGEVETQFEILRREQKAEGQEPWHPFPSKNEWELARWLMESATSQSKIDSFIKLEAVRV